MLEHAGSLLVMGQLVAHKVLLKTGPRPPTRSFSNLLLRAARRGLSRALFVSGAANVACSLCAVRLHCWALHRVWRGSGPGGPLCHRILYSHLHRILSPHSCNYACLASIAVVDPYQNAHIGLSFGRLCQGNQAGRCCTHHWHSVVAAQLHSADGPRVNPGAQSAEGARRLAGQLPHICSLPALPAALPAWLHEAPSQVGDRTVLLKHEPWIIITC